MNSTFFLYHIYPVVLPLKASELGDEQLGGWIFLIFLKKTFLSGNSWASFWSLFCSKLQTLHLDSGFKVLQKKPGILYGTVLAKIPSHVLIRPTLPAYLLLKLAPHKTGTHFIVLVFIIHSPLFRLPSRPVLVFLNPWYKIRLNTMVFSEVIINKNSSVFTLDNEKDNDTAFWRYS